MSKIIAKKTRGRPLEFDRDETLSRAIELFWAQGYEGTSLSDLTSALGINRPSIYASFGNKETLFELALNKYIEAHLDFINEAIKETRLIDVIERLLTEEINLATNSEVSKGCLLIQSAMIGNPKLDMIKTLIIDQRKLLEAKLRKRIQRAQLSNDQKTDASPAILAKAITTLYAGISIEAASGATKKELLELIPLAKKMLI